jgi:hypothetical protein
MKKMLAVFFVAVLFVAVVPVYAEESGSVPGKSKIGGHVKFSVYDSADGVTGWGTSSALTFTAKSSQYTGMGFREFILYVSQEITDQFSVEVCPVLSVRTGATPSLGTIIGKQKSASPSLSALDLDRAVLKYMAPWEIELTFGIFKPVFTMNYGYELFWEEEYNGGKFVCNPNLGVMHETGLEIYRNFYIADVVALPVYLYALNGGSYYVDSNNQPMLAAHIEPEYGPVKIGASFAAQKFDTKEQKWSFRYTGGAAFNWKGIQARVEYAAGDWQNDIMTTTNTYNARAEGFYATASYKLPSDWNMDWLKVFYTFEYALQNFNGTFSHSSARGGGDKYVQHTAGLDIYITPASMLQFQVDVADWRRRDNSLILIFTRPTLGARVTF